MNLLSVYEGGDALMYICAWCSFQLRYESVAYHQSNVVFDKADLCLSKTPMLTAINKKTILRLEWTRLYWLCPVSHVLVGHSPA